MFDKRGIWWNQTIQENGPEHKSDRDTQLLTLRRAGKREAPKEQDLAESPREDPEEVVSLVPAPLR